MSTSPATVTVTATLLSILGSAASSNSRLRITLCNFTGRQPEVTGSGLIAEVSEEQVFAGTALSFAVIPNDTIVPAGTFYCVQVYDAADNCIEAANYQVLSSGGTTQDLATLSVFDPNAVTLMGAVPNGPFPGRAFNLPVPAAHGLYGELWYNGGLQGPRDFEVAGLSLALNFDTQAGDELYVRYPIRSAAGDAYVPFVAIANGKRPGTVFTVPTAPSGAQFAGVYVNGVIQIPGTYTLSAGTLTLLNTQVQSTTDDVFVLYVTSALTVVGETPAGTIPGQAYTVTHTPKAVIGLYLTGLYLRPGIDYTLGGEAIATTNPTVDGDTLYAFYLV